MSQDEDNDDFDFVAVDDLLQQQVGEDSNLGIMRTPARLGLRAAESIAGLPGDLFQTVRSVRKSLPGGIEEEPDPVQDPLRAALRFGLESLPGSEELRARSAEAFPTLEPEGEFEEFVDEVVSDAAPLLLPVKGKVPFARALGISLAGNLGAETAKAFGRSEGEQAATKFGVMFLASMFRKGGGVKKHISNLYKEADASIGAGASVNYQKPLKALNALEVRLKKGAIDESTKPVLDMIESIRSKVVNGRMPVDEAVAFDRSISEIMLSGKLQRGGKLLKAVDVANEGALLQYGEKNRKWLDLWNEARMAKAGIEQSQKIQRYIRNNVSARDVGHGLIAFGIEEAVLPGRAQTQIVTAAGASAAAYGAEVLKRISTNPALRRYYINVVNAAATENKAMLTRNMAGLDRAFKKELEKNPITQFEFDEDDGS